MKNVQIILFNAPSYKYMHIQGFQRFYCKDRFVLFEKRFYVFLKPILALAILQDIFMS